MKMKAFLHRSIRFLQLHPLLQLHPVIACMLSPFLRWSRADACPKNWVDDDLLIGRL
jgi:hypothetical protein